MVIMPHFYDEVESTVLIATLDICSEESSTRRNVLFDVCGITFHVHVASHRKSYWFFFGKGVLAPQTTNPQKGTVYVNFNPASVDLISKFQGTTNMGMHSILGFQPLHDIAVKIRLDGEYSKSTRRSGKVSEQLKFGRPIDFAQGVADVCVAATRRFPGEVTIAILEKMMVTGDLARPFAADLEADEAADDDRKKAASGPDSVVVNYRSPEEALLGTLDVAIMGLVVSDLNDADRLVGASHDGGVPVGKGADKANDGGGSSKISQLARFLYRILFTDRIWESKVSQAVKAKREAKAGILSDIVRKIRRQTHPSYHTGLMALVHYLSGTKKWVMNMESKMGLSNGFTWARVACNRLSDEYEKVVLPCFVTSVFSQIVLIFSDNHELKCRNVNPEIKDGVMTTLTTTCMRVEHVKGLDVPLGLDNPESLPFILPYSPSRINDYASGLRLRHLVSIQKPHMFLHRDVKLMEFAPEDAIPKCTLKYSSLHFGFPLPQLFCLFGNRENPNC